MAPPFFACWCHLSSGCLVLLILLSLSRCQWDYLSAQRSDKGNKRIPAYVQSFLSSSRYLVAS